MALSVTASSAATSFTPNDLKYLIWLAGIFASTLIGGVTATWWYSRDQSKTRREIYGKINFVERSVSDRLEQNNKECSNTKERVGLLEQSHNHLERRMDDMDGKLATIQSDIASVKEAQLRSEQKSSEQVLNIIGEVRSIGDKITMNKLLEATNK